MKAGEGLTGRYCLLQGSYYGVNCAVIGYASVFLLERGMSPAGIGALIAAGNVLSAVLQPHDRRHRRPVRARHVKTNDQAGSRSGGQFCPCLLAFSGA